MTEEELTKVIEQKAAVKAAELLAGQKAEIDEKFKHLNDSALREAEARGQKPMPEEVKMGRLLRIMHEAKGDAKTGKLIIDKFYDAFPAKSEIKGMLDIIEKSGNVVSTPADGGFTVPQILSDRIIEVLYAQSAVGKTGMTILPMPNGNLSLPRMNAGATIAYFGETAKAPYTKSTFGQVLFTGKKLGATSVLSRDLIRSNSVNVDAWLIRDLQRKFALKQDYTALYGSGVSGQPLGLNSLINQTTNVLGSSSTAFTSDIPLQLVVLLNSLDVPEEDRAWIMHPQIWGYIANIKSTTGQFIFREEMSRGTLFGYPVFQTTQSGYTNTGTYATSSADIWLGSWREFIRADQLSMEITTSFDASYDDGSGLQSAFQQDQQVIRIVGVHDYNIMHDVSVIKGTYKFAAS